MAGHSSKCCSIICVLVSCEMIFCVWLWAHAWGGCARRARAMVKREHRKLHECHGRVAPRRQPVAVKLLVKLLCPLALTMVSQVSGSRDVLVPSGYRQHTEHAISWAAIVFTIWLFSAFFRDPCKAGKMVCLCCNCCCVRRNRNFQDEACQTVRDLGLQPR